jgi:HPt (histidine-containing phosphotransfer) domain-containing protein
MNQETLALNGAYLLRGIGAARGDQTIRTRLPPAPACAAGSGAAVSAPRPGLFSRLEALMPVDPGLVRRTLGSFVIQHSGDPDRLAELLAAAHGPGVRRLAVALKRNAAQLGALDLAEAAQEMESASESDAAARAALARLRGALRQVIDAADAWLAAHPSVAPQAADRDQLLDASLARLQTMIVARDWGSLREAEHIAGEVRGRLTAVQAAKLDAVIAALRRFGFDQAALGLDALRKARA